jgi:flagellin
LQVAEGAAEQIQNMLVRLKELATQAASANAGSNLDKLNNEKTQLLLEIDKIAGSTEYADVALINGTYGVGISAASTATSAKGLTNATGLVALEDYTFTSVAGTGSTVTLTSTTGSGSQTINDISVPGAGQTGSVTFDAFGVTLSFNSNLSATSLNSAVLNAKDTGNSTFQVGAENTNDNRISISLGNLTTSSSGLNISAISFSTASDAQSALDTIDTAIGTLNTVRGNIGAYVNQLTYHSANLATTIENVQGAESVIRDVDMAAEMTTFTKNQILLQAGTAMLAQANMAPQQLLALFG